MKKSDLSYEVLENPSCICRFLKGTHGTTPSQGVIDTTRMDYCGSDSILVTPYADGIIPDYLLFYYSWQ